MPLCLDASLGAPIRNYDKPQILLNLLTNPGVIIRAGSPRCSFTCRQTHVFNPYQRVDAPIPDCKPKCSYIYLQAQRRKRRFATFFKNCDCCCHVISKIYVWRISNFSKAHSDGLGRVWWEQLFMWCAVLKSQSYYYHIRLTYIKPYCEIMITYG